MIKCITDPAAICGQGNDTHLMLMKGRTWSTFLNNMLRNSSGSGENRGMMVNSWSCVYFTFLILIGPKHCSQMLQIVSQFHHRFKASNTISIIENERDIHMCVTITKTYFLKGLTTPFHKICLIFIQYSSSWSLLCMSDWLAASRNIVSKESLRANSPNIVESR